MNVRTALRWLALMGLAACGYSEDKFLVNSVEPWCERPAECAGTFEAATCVDVFRSTDRTGCDYDPEAARECHDALETAACIEDSPFELMILDVPAACESVYVCAGVE